MPNIKTNGLTKVQYQNIIETMKAGFNGCMPNDQVATALVLEANLGIRIADIIQLKLSDIVEEDGRMRLDIIEQKTGKPRYFIIPEEIYNYIKDYCVEHEIKSNEIIFPITAHEIHKQLKLVCNHLGYQEISTHSFRKFFATQIYINNYSDSELVNVLLQHSSLSVTQKYMGINSRKAQEALQNNISLI